PATTPAAGPDSMVWTARRAASAADITPPLDSITCTGAVIPMAASRSRNARRYVLITGPTYADMTVVVARSYSRISGQISDDATTVIESGSVSRSNAATRSSCAGLAYEWRRQIATAAT